MSDSRRYQPADDEETEFRNRLGELILAALRLICDQGGGDVALALADRIDHGRWRLRTRGDIGVGGEPDDDSLWFVVQVEADNGWLELCSAHWSALGVTAEGAREELRWTALQNGFGIPDDLSGLEGSPS